MCPEYSVPTSWLFPMLGLGSIAHLVRGNTGGMVLFAEVPTKGFSRFLIKSPIQVF